MTTAGMVDRLEKIEKFFVSDYGYPQAETIKEAATLITAQSARIEELEAEISAPKDDRHYWFKRANTQQLRAETFERQYRQVSEDHASAMAECLRLREALEPFAKAADARSNLALGHDIDHWPIGGSALTLGDLRRARSALQQGER